MPRDILPLSTMFRPESISNNFDEAHELSDFTGISPFDLVAFRPERLIAHEMLIRVTADLTVPDGPNYEDLGINLRGMVQTVLEKYIEPELPGLVKEFSDLKVDVSKFIREELEKRITRTAITGGGDEERPGFLGRLFRRPAGKKQIARVDDEAERTLTALASWSSQAKRDDDPFKAACLDGLFKVVNTIVGTRGKLIADREIVVKLATIYVCNGYGSEFLGKAVEPIFALACRKEGYRILPAQPEPVIMNVKGASASGKSTMRPLQRELAGRLGVPWQDFALISPDYWRKFLLDYDSLGPVYKYAGALTGHELAIIDKKLDLYMAQKAEGGRMSHLLIDRFRFDSFSPEEDREADSKLLTRFGKTIFLFFVVTPPEATVERAWSRGLKTGRFKAVDDLLFHNIEAFTGMPQLFFSWALSKGKKVHYEFLDNSVPEGERPRTIASGWNGRMSVYDVEGVLNIERFRKIDIEASNPEGVYEEGSQDARGNLGFLQQCVKFLDRIQFIDPVTREVYGVVDHGHWTWRDEEASSRSQNIAEILNMIELKGELDPTVHQGYAAPAKSEPGEEINYNVGRLQ